MEFAFVKPILTVLASKAFVDFWAKWKLDESLKRKLQSYLMVIGTVLNYADDAQIEDPHIKNWLEDVKDAVYDAEDLLDEIANFNSPPEAQSGSSSKVRHFLPSWARNGIKSMKKPMKFKGRDILDTLNPFGERVDARMKSIVERLKPISEQKDILKLRETDGKQIFQMNVRLTASVIDESNRLYGRDQDKQKIINLLDQTEEVGDSNRVTVIVIYGMGGLGKTTLAQIVYNDVKKRGETEGEFFTRFDVQAWACVSDAFDVKKTTKDLLESATGRTSGVGDNLELIQNGLMEELRNKRFLLVLDDIWTHEYEDWDKLSIPFSVGGHGSKIIVTTRNEKVISSIRHQVIPYMLTTLGEDDCWSLFKGIAFPNGNSTGFPKLETIGKQIVVKCKGLPLAAKTIGGLLRHKRKDQEQWEDVLNSSVWDSPSQKYLPALILSYHHLTVEERQCFAYCSLFPKDYKFHTEELVLLWMAEGFLSNSDDENGNLEATGREYFDNLLSMSFLQQYGDGESSLYVMHDLIHDLAQFVAGKSYLRLDEAYQKDKNNTINNKARRFSFQRGEFDVYMKFKPISEVKCLRTFLPFGVIDVFYLHYLSNKVPNQLIPHLKFLRVLSLRGYHFVSKLPDSIGDLKHLRYLDLSFTCISRLPDAVNRLHNLHTLLLENCSDLTRLPVKMEGLVRLRHLKLDETKLTQMPMGMEKMTRLRTLSNFVIGEENGSGIDVFKNLSNLQGKVHISGLSNVVKATDAREANFKAKQHLKEVVLDWGDVSSSPRNLNMEQEFMMKLHFHENLTKLTIGGYGGKEFHEWMIEDLPNLVYVHIYDCRNCESLPSLGKLSRLKVLIIKGLDRIKSLDDVYYGTDDPFPSLETLGLEDMKEWEEWCPLADQQKGFGRLRELSIVKCPKLWNVSHQFMSLNKLQIRSCGNLAAFSSSHDCLSLMSLEIEGCDKLVELPRIERLRKFRLWQPNDELFASVISDLSSNTGRPAEQSTELEVVEMCGCKAAVKMPNEQRGLEVLVIGGSRRERLDLPAAMLPDLETVEFRDYLHLQKLPDQLSRLQSLRELRLQDCPEMVSFPDGGLPSMLKRLEIEKCPRLETIPEGALSNSNMLEGMRIRDCDSLASFDGKLPVSLKTLWICNCPDLKLLPQGLTSLVELFILQCSTLNSFPNTVSGDGGGGSNELPMKLEYLSIEKCDKLRSLPQCLPNLTSLRELAIGNCPLIAQFPNGGLATASLRAFRIWNCPRMRKLPQGIHRSCNLEVLNIDGCPSLDCLPQLPRALKCLEVLGCERWGRIEEWGLDGLESLADLGIGGIRSLESLTDEYLLPKSITRLVLADLPNLKSVSVNNFTSLRELGIINCEKLESLPKKGLPETLCSLAISKCPLLKRRCERGGADWPHVADLPAVFYEDDLGVELVNK